MNLFSDRMKPRNFFRLTAPAVLSMVVLALYSVVDGVFVARLVGEDALAAINITLPLTNLAFGIAIMLASGGSAAIGKLLGEKKEEEACRGFSMLVLVGVLIGLVLALTLTLFQKEALGILGATERIYDYCYVYGVILCLTMPVVILKMLLEYFIRADGNARLSLWLSIAGGVTNIALDYLFIKVMGMGIAGAALGTTLGYVVPALLGLAYFFLKGTGLRFTRPSFDVRLLLKSCSNGSSEMVSEFSTGVTTMLFNLVTLRYLGEAGLSAITIILYAHFLLNSVYLGFVCGVAPAISYNYGAHDRNQLRTIMRYSRNFLIGSSILVFAASVFGAPILIGIFANPGTEVFTVAMRGLLLFSGCFLFIGTNVFSSGVFTAYGNGGVSALISFLRAFAFPVAGVIALPALLGADGIWIAIPAAEFTTISFSLFFLWRYRHDYHYAREKAGKPPLKRDAKKEKSAAAAPGK